MKKLILMLTFIGSLGFFINSGMAQESVDPGDGNSAGGVCCMQTRSSCAHPSAGVFADSVWSSGQSTC